MSRLGRLGPLFVGRGVGATPGDEAPEAVYFRRVKSKTKPRCVLTKEGAREVARLLSEGHSMEGVADELGIAKSTLYADHNRELLDEAKNRGEVKLRDNIRVKQIEVAMSGDVKMLIFLGKQYLGQTEHPAPAVVPVSPIPAYIEELFSKVREDDEEFRQSEEYRAWCARCDREEEARRRGEPGPPPSP